MKFSAIRTPFTPTTTDPSLPVNLELKARVPTLDEARRIALDAGAQFGGVFFQVDTYFHVPNGRLKLRVINDEAAELIRYDREEKSEERVSRYEKYEVHDREMLWTMLAAALGVDVVVRKRRELFWYKGARVHLDEIENLGAFVEFEIPSSGITDPATLMSELRATFGVDSDAILRLSYSDLLRDRNHDETNHVTS